MKNLTKTEFGYLYKGFYISKAKSGYRKGFSCTEIKLQQPLTLKEIVAKIDSLIEKEYITNKCQVCTTSTNLITDETRDYYRSLGWSGVDFYIAICDDCFQLEKEKI